MVNNNVPNHEFNYENNMPKKQNVYIVTKRLFDLIAAILSLVLLLPMLIITAIAIKIDSPGPILFSQPRVGYKGVIFKMYKFRTMIKDTDIRYQVLESELESENVMCGYMFKIKSDPRVTRAGRFLRKTSIDELPQLINVLKGEMSFVGPRPVLVYEMKNVEYINILKYARPGITGLFAVTHIGNFDIDELLKIENQYIKNRSLKYDFIILRKTIIASFGGRGAF